MKLILFFTIGIFNFSYSQSKLVFSYDLAGNQTTRKYEEVISVAVSKIEKENSIIETPIEDYIKIYPNPTHGNLKIEWTHSLNFTINHIFVFDMTGQGWEHQYEKNNTSSTDIDLTEKPAGFYIIRFELSNNEIITRKIIKK